MSTHQVSTIEAADESHASFERGSTTIPNLFNAKPSKKRSIPVHNELCRAYEYWIQLTVAPVLPYLMSGATALVLILIASFYPPVRWSAVNQIKFFFICPFLVLLPFWHSTTFVSSIGSGAGLIVAVVQLEDVFGRQQCLTSYLAVAIIYRIFTQKMISDSFAIAVAYSSSLAALLRPYRHWYVISNMMIWIYLAVGIVLLLIFQRLVLRMWYCSRILIIAAARSEREKIAGDYILSSQLSADIMEHLYPSTSEESSSDAAQGTSTQDSPDPNAAAIRNESNIRNGRCFLCEEDTSLSSGLAAQSTQNGQDEILKAHLDCGIIMPFRHSKLSMAQLENISGMDRRACSVVLVNFPCEEREKKGAEIVDEMEKKISSVYDSSRYDLEQEVLTLANNRRATMVRRFGDAWIGCIGYFKSYGSEAEDAFQAAVFGCEVLTAARRRGVTVTVALDFDNFVGGFMNSLHFELYGQRMRWLLMVSELQVFDEVIVGGPIIHKLITFNNRRTGGNQKTFSMKKITATIPWQGSTEMSVSIISNVTEVVDALSMTTALGANEPTPIATGDSFSQWRLGAATLQELIDEDLSTEEKLKYHSILGRCQHGYRDVHSALQNAGLEEEIGMEFRKGLFQLHGVNPNDPVLWDKDSDTVLRLQNSMLTKIFSIIRETCFPSWLRLLFVWSTYKDTDGMNEFPTYLPSAEQHQSAEEEGYGDPIILMLRGTCFETWYRSLVNLPVPSDIHPVEKVPSRNQVKPHNGRSAQSFSALKHKVDHDEDLEMNSSTYIIHKKPVQLQNRKAKYKFREFKPSSVTPIAEEDEHEECDDFGKCGNDEIHRPQEVSDHKYLGRDDAEISKNGNKTSKFRGSEDQAEVALTDFKRSFWKYALDVKMISPSTVQNILFAMACIIPTFIYNTIYLPSQYEVASYGGTNFFILYFIILNAVVEQRFQWVWITSIVVISFVTTVWTRSYEGCPRLFLHSGRGDLGGDVNVLVASAVSFPYLLRNHPLLSPILIVVVVTGSLLRQSNGGTECQLSRFSNLMIAAYLLLMFAIFWSLHYLAFCAYIVEHKLVPAALNNYHKQRINTRRLLFAFTPQVPYKHGYELYTQKRFRECAMVAIHVKAGDILSSMLDEKDLMLVLQSIDNVVGRCIAESGMLKVGHFSGVYVAVACVDPAFDTIEALRFPDNHIARAVALLRNIQRKILKFGRINHFNLEVGIGINKGEGSLGFQGSTLLRYDLTGPSRNAAVTMASYNTDGVYCSEEFETDVRKTQAVEDLISIVPLGVISEGHAFTSRTPVRRVRPQISRSFSDGSFESMREFSKRNISGGSIGSTKSSGAKSSGGNSSSSKKGTVVSTTQVKGNTWCMPNTAVNKKWLRIDGNFNVGLDDFDYICMLGKGGYGSVHLMAEKKSGTQFAIKGIVLKHGSILPKIIERECSILQMMQHPNVLNLKYSFRTHNRLYLVMSYVRGGNLREVLQRDNLELSHLYLWFAELVLAIEYVHSVGIIHRDIKPANCMIGTDGHLKLADFGLAKVVTVPSYSKGRNESVIPRYLGNSKRAGLRLSADAFTKVQKFQPVKLLRSDGAMHGSEASIGKSDGEVGEQSFRVLLISSQKKRKDFPLHHRGFIVTVVVSPHLFRWEELKKKEISAIFVDGDNCKGLIHNQSREIRRNEDNAISDAVKHMISESLSTVPVFVISKSSELRQQALAAGAQACLSAGVEYISDDVFQAMLSMAPQETLPSQYTEHLEDLIQYQVAQQRLQQEAGVELSSSQHLVMEGNSIPMLNDSQAARDWGKLDLQRIDTDGDVSTSNVLESQNHTAETKQTDGQGKRVAADEVTVHSRTHSFVGTLYFIAPEVVRFRKYGTPVDWWACGMTFYECITRDHMFKGKDNEVLKQIKSAKINLSKVQHCGEDLVSLLRGLLCRDVKMRLGSPDASNIKGHEFFKGVDWALVSTSKPMYKPAQFVNRKFNQKEKDEFYGIGEKVSTVPLGVFDKVEEYHGSEHRVRSKNKKRGRSVGTTEVLRSTS